MKLVLIEWLIATGLTLSLIGCSGNSIQNVELVFYELSGGIAGYSLTVKIYESGRTVAEDKGIVGEVMLQPQEIVEAKEVLQRIPADLLSRKSPPEPECCDQIVSIVRYKGQYVDLNSVEAALSSELNELFQRIAKKAIAAAGVGESKEDRTEEGPKENVDAKL